MFGFFYARIVWRHLKIIWEDDLNVKSMLIFKKMTFHEIIRLKRTLDKIKYYKSI